MAACMNDDSEVHVSQAALQRAEKDLDWWYNCREAQLGLRAAGIEPGLGASWSGVEVEDAAGEVFRFEGAVVKLFGKPRTAAARRFRKVSLALSGMTEHECEMARDLYAARNVSSRLDEVFSVKEAVRDGGQSGTLNLVGLVPHTGPFRAAHLAASRERVVEFGHGSKIGVARTREGAGLRGPLEWLDWSCRSRVEGGRTVNSRLPAWVVEARREARRIRLELLRAYAVSLQRNG